ncbi:metalloregulator ArsR/SmtB family transcription factor [Methanosarcina sp.]|uniref:ArsR/SmtB family transcription factor n=2 Tax=Methanosarcina sp. TaxID=2213 RepID=UPI0029883A45|nr:metalloregulator ArsR/SmtB family transcription factor [Methanosarcina sp.]MDW5550431.1 metalloregulator ArsR/SmtB family transcription factor [Methanosarcina sp.]MDW5559946.1 metalloregulator ArsR/SmtB family transcription factor [Methanosarcina sp.]
MSIIAYTHLEMVVPMDIVYILKALADENRIRILNLLKNRELCVCDIEAVLGIKQSNTSRHLNKLKIAGIIVSVKKSQWVYYRLNDSTFQKFPFLSMIISDEVEKINICKDDLVLLEKLKASDRRCE